MHGEAVSGWTVSFSMPNGDPGGLHHHSTEETAEAERARLESKGYRDIRVSKIVGDEAAARVTADSQT